MKISGQPLVSVVTPVYNGEKYLAECIESVLAQTYKNWEYVIIDNRSTDRSPDIIQRYENKDKRIRFHTNTEFVSAIENHHRAFNQISPESKYCKVIHADDWLYHECIEKMVAVAERNPSVGIVGSYRLDGVWVNLDGLPYNSEIVAGRQICRDTLLGGPYIFGSPSSLLIRSDIVRDRHPFYDENNFSVHADTAACYDILQAVDFGFVHQVLTFTRRHGEAQTKIARTVNSYIWTSLMILRKYGPFYLDAAEYEKCINKEIENYCRFLAKAFYQNKDKAFWEYHKDKMEKIGHPLTMIKVMCRSKNLLVL
jgi:glycosyltransferase involved in cell wall biosynthesis